MKGMKRFIAMVTVTAMSMALMAGCGKKGGSEGDGTFENAPVVYYAIPNTFESAIGKTGDSYTDNDYIRYIWEKTGVKVQPVLLSNNLNEMTQQLATKRAGGEKIDLIRYNDLNQGWMQSNLIIPLNDFFKKYGDEIKGWNPYKEDECRIVDSGWKFVKKDDTYWGVAGRTLMSNNGSRWFYIRRDWLDKLELDMPENTDELGNILKAFTERDPDGNGQKDTWGMAHNNSSTVNNLLMTLGIDSWREYIVNDNGDIDENGTKLISQSMHPYAKGQYAQIRNWCQNGWINQDGVTDTTAYEKLITNNKIGVVLENYTNIRKYQDALEKNGYVDAKFEFCEPHIINSYDGNFYGFSAATNAGSVTMLTSMAKESTYPAIIKLMNWMYSDEGTFFQTYGLEGKEYTMKDGEPVVDKDYMAEKSYKDLFNFGKAYDLTFDEEIDRVYGTTKLAKDYVNSVEKNDYATARTDVKFNYPNIAEFTTYPDWRKGVEQYLLLFTVGDKDPMNDKDWNEYIDICNSYGIQKLMDAAAKEKFGK